MTERAKRRMVQMHAYMLNVQATGRRPKLEEICVECGLAPSSGLASRYMHRMAALGMAKRNPGECGWEAL